jgi:hypothetical protein
MDDGMLHVGGETFDVEDLTYAEKRAVRRIVRTELWDETVDGEFDWDEVGENEVLPATIAVFMRRTNPDYTLADAMALKPREVYGDVPPTSAGKSSSRASARKKTSAATGAPA